MYDLFFEDIMKWMQRMDRRILDNMIRGRRVYIWGADKKGERVARCLIEKAVPVEGFLDIALRKNSMDLPVKLPQEIIGAEEGGELYFIWISMLLKHKDVVMDYLEVFGFTKDDYFYPAMEWSFLAKGRYSHWSETDKLELGRCVAEGLDRNKFYFFPGGYTHIGDVALALSWLWAFRCEKHISRLTVLISEKLSGLARLYSEDIDEILVKEQKELEALSSFLEADRQVHYNNIIGYEWNFISKERQTPVPLTLLMYKTEHLGISYAAASKHIKGLTGGYNWAVDKYKIKKGKSVILIPYARSAGMLPFDFWTAIAADLNKEYVVYTNVADNEIPVHGTIPINIPLEYMIDIVNYAGHAVSVRCGVADLLALGNCNCWVLYYMKNSVEERYSRVNRLYVNGKESILYRNAIDIPRDFDICETVEIVKAALSGKNRYNE